VKLFDGVGPTALIDILPDSNSNDIPDAAIVKATKWIDTIRTRLSGSAILFLVGALVIGASLTPGNDALAQSESDGLNPGNATGPQGSYKNRLGRHIYLGFGLGASDLSPDASEVPGVDFIDENEPAFQFNVGVDVNKWLAAELQAVDLGTIDFSPSGSIDYREIGASALFYVGKSRHGWKRRGFSAFGRAGVGFLDNQGSGGIDFDQINPVHLLLGVGAEWNTTIGLGIRAEFTTFEEDINFANLGLIYRFGRPQRTRPPQTVQQAIEPVISQPIEAPISTPIPAVAVLDNDQDGVIDSEDLCPTTAVGVAVDSSGCAIFSGTLQGVNFPSNSAFLVDSAKARLDEVVGTLIQYPQMQFELSAHTDNQGDAGANQALSAKRARAVAAYLVQSGIDVNRMTARAFGETVPIDTNETAEGRRNNRRVELNAFR